MIARRVRMKPACRSLLLAAVVGFMVSVGVHVLSLWGRASASEIWIVVPFLGAIASFVLAAFLSGVTLARRGVPMREIVRQAPTWLQTGTYFFAVYLAIVMAWLLYRSFGISRWAKVELDARTGFVVFSAFSMDFYVNSAAMLFRKCFREKYRTPTLSGVAAKSA
jgi:hypothetical protein